jgi:hypothetical protein
MTTMMHEDVQLASEKVLEHGLPEVLPEEFHEAIQASWEMPAYEREVKTPPSRRPLIVGLVVGGLALAAGFGVGYYAQSTLTEAESIAISQLAGPDHLTTSAFGSPTDANGLNLGRRVAPLDVTRVAPTGIPFVSGFYGNFSGGPESAGMVGSETYTPSD